MRSMILLAALLSAAAPVALAKGKAPAAADWRTPDPETILVIDKYVERLIRIADRHTIIERGRVAWQGSSAELDADHALWHRYLGV